MASGLVVTNRNALIPSNPTHIKNGGTTKSHNKTTTNINTNTTTTTSLGSLLSNGSQQIQLETIIGSSVINSQSIDASSSLGLMAFPAGCVVVLTDLNSKKQYFLQNRNKPVTCLKFAPGGRYLAVGESGHQPTVCIWDLSNLRSLSEEGVAISPVAELKYHKFGINSISFSPSGKWLVSCGVQHDGNIALWDWIPIAQSHGNNVSSSTPSISVKVPQTKINSVIIPDDTHFVSCGVRHLKFWYINGSTTSVYSVESRSAVLGSLQTQCNNMVDCVSVTGSSREFHYIFMTSSGLVFSLGSNRTVQRWVQLVPTQVSGSSQQIPSFSLGLLGDRYLACASSDAIIRLLDPKTLEYLATLPRPSSLATSSPTKTQRFPDCVKACLLASSLSDNAATLPELGKIVCAYEDRSICVWEPSDKHSHSGQRKHAKPSFVCRYHLSSHSSCIWDLDICPESAGSIPEGTLATCSSDGTIRFWTLNGNTPLYTLRVTPPQAVPRGEDDETTDNNEGLRCISFSPRGEHIASGDRQGNIRVHGSDNFECLHFKEAHDAEVLTISYNTMEDTLLMATAGRDRLVHIFDADNQYDPVDTLEDHSSSITSIKWIEPSETQQQLKLVSCSADKSIVFRNVEKTRNSYRFKRVHLASMSATIFDMNVSVMKSEGTRVVIAGGKDRRVCFYNADTGKLIKSHRIDSEHPGQLASSSPMIDVLKIKLDRSGSLMAISCSDRTIRLFDVTSGDFLCKLSGHSEVVTGLAFSLDCKNLISTSGDGCIFVWQLPVELSKLLAAKSGYVPQKLAPQTSECSNTLNIQFQSNIKSPGGSLLFQGASQPSWLRRTREQQMGIRNDENIDPNTILLQTPSNPRNLTKRRYSVEKIDIAATLMDDLCLDFTDENNKDDAEGATQIQIQTEPLPSSADSDAPEIHQSVPAAPEPCNTEEETFSSADQFISSNFDVLEFPDFSSGSSTGANRLSLSMKYVKSMANPLPPASSKAESTQPVKESVEQHKEPVEAEAEAENTAANPSTSDNYEQEEALRRRQRREHYEREVEKTRQRLAALGMRVPPAAKPFTEPKLKPVEPEVVAQKESELSEEQSEQQSELLKQTEDVVKQNPAPERFNKILEQFKESSTAMIEAWQEVSQSEDLRKQFVCTITNFTTQLQTMGIIEPPSQPQTDYSQVLINLGLLLQQQKATITLS